MTRAALLLALVAVWYLAPDLALLADISTSAVQYRADGILGAALALLLRDAAPADAPGVIWRAICDAAALLWIAHPVCDIYIPTPGADTASICDDVTGSHWSSVAAVLLAALAGWLADYMRGIR